MSRTSDSLFFLSIFFEAILSALLNAEKLDVGPNLTSFKVKIGENWSKHLPICFALVRYFAVWCCVMPVWFGNAPCLISYHKSPYYLEISRYLKEFFILSNASYCLTVDSLPRSSQLASTPRWRAWPLATVSQSARPTYLRRFRICFSFFFLQAHNSFRQQSSFEIVHDKADGTLGHTAFANYGIGCRQDEKGDAFHFVCYICHEGKVYELDGQNLQKLSICLPVCLSTVFTHVYPIYLRRNTTLCYLLCICALSILICTISFVSKSAVCVEVFLSLSNCSRSEGRPRLHCWCASWHQLGRQGTWQNTYSVYAQNNSKYHHKMWSTCKNMCQVFNVLWFSKIKRSRLMLGPWRAPEANRGVGAIDGCLTSNLPNHAPRRLTIQNLQNLQNLHV